MKTAKALRRILRDDIGDSVSISELAGAFRGRAFFLLMLLFALPNALPGPSLPGLSTVTGLPLALIAAQMALGFRRPEFPGPISRQTLNRARLAGLVARVAPHLDRVERWVEPRLGVLVSARATRLLSAGCALLALVMALPIPLGNLLPAWAIVLLSLGLFSRNGLVVAAGLALGIVALAWNVAVVAVGAELLVGAWRWVTG